MQFAADIANSLATSKKRVSFPDDHVLFQNGGPPSALASISVPHRHRHSHRLLSLISAVPHHHPNCAKMRKANAIGARRQSIADQHPRRSPSFSRSPSLLSASTTDGRPTKADEETSSSFQEEFIRQEDTSFESEFVRVLGRLQQVIERNELRLMEKDRRNAEKLGG